MIEKLPKRFYEKEEITGVIEAERIDKINDLIDELNNQRKYGDYSAYALNNHADRLDKLETKMYRVINSINENEERLKSLENAQEKQEESILACPFCKDEIFNIDDNLEGYMWVICMNCEAGGPPRQTKQEAINAWNSRK